ncbi:TPA: hypothetical protein QIW60_003580 [Escherichia coli]|nr:hypothetical protein [Salmonella enterica]EAT8674973.1 hypothetical protein [Salmonella enterica]EES5376846.1 hypothetical protein [Escherichia coli]EES5680342.1 hypothetical protein [Escherichia coli]HDS3454416.1 hypothetical protein [Escherichia coli]
MTDFVAQPLKPTFKETVLQLIIDIENNFCWKLALRKARENVTATEYSLIIACIHDRRTGYTLERLRKLYDSILETMVIAEFECGSQHRFIYPEEVCINVLREYVRKGIKAWIELV